MSSRAQHYREAERLLQETKDETCVWAQGVRERMLYTAAIHADLACVPLSVYNEYLDLQYTEVLREDVVNTPPPDSRDWLKDDEAD